MLNAKAALRRECASLASSALPWDVSLDLSPYRTVFIYHSFGNEPNTLPLVKHALDSGIRLCLPRIGNSGMTARVVTELATLTPNRYGIDEPPENAEAVNPNDIDLCVVPAVALGFNGSRLGRGGGFYDRWLAGFDGVSVGVCNGSCLFPSVPSEAHDIRVKFILTETLFKEAETRYEL